MVSYALLFPGQGSQYVGMGQELTTRSAQLFDHAQDVLSLPLKKLMLEGPQDELTKTAIAQPAILLHSVAVFTTLQEQSDIKISAVLGHSLGEYSALVVAGVLSLDDALRAVHTRGQLMQEATPIGFGSMSAVLGLDAATIVDAMSEFADESSPAYASCANFNGPLQTVIAGTKLGIEKASSKLSSLGAKRIIPLPVSAPFHCALMKPAAEKMAKVFAELKFSDARYPVISNVIARNETNGEKIRGLLLQQITQPIRFTECVEYVVNNQLIGDGFLELGPKNALSGMVKKISSAPTFNIDTAQDIDAFLSRGIA